jgi:GNAT superfamily N-acetyltransferase
MASAPKIRKLTPTDIPKLWGFAPLDWNCDISAIFGLHHGEGYFYGIVAAVDGKLVGCGNGISNGEVGWLGNIIVLEQHRRRGIGRALTEHLIDAFKAKGCRTQLLVATSMGEELYRQLGFSVTSRYEFYDGPRLLATARNPRIRKASPRHFAHILSLDREISGERRDALIARFLAPGVVMRAASGDGISGFYLPSFGGGLIEAIDDASGLALLEYKHGLAQRQAVIPEENESARSFLLSRGFTFARSAPRMSLGPEVAWKPRRVFARATGYTG